MEIEFNPNLCQRRTLHLSFPHQFKNRRVPQTLARFLPATIRLLFADCCPAQCACLLGSFPLWSHHSLWSPLILGQRFEEGLVLSPGTSCQLHYLSPQGSRSDVVDRESPWQAWLRGSDSQGQYGRTKLPQGEEVLGQVAVGFTPVAAQQEKRLLSPKMFFLLFWPKSPFVIKLLSWDL